MTSTIFCEPTRQGTHLPQDSLRKKRVKFNAPSTIDRPSASTMIAPEPIVAPAAEIGFFACPPAVSFGKSIGRARDPSAPGRNPHERPHRAHALIALPP